MIHDSSDSRVLRFASSRCELLAQPCVCCIIEEQPCVCCIIEELVCLLSKEARLPGLSPADSPSIIAMERRGSRSRSTGNSSISTSLSTTQIKEIASQLSHHPQIHNFFSKNVVETAWHISRSRFRRGELLSCFHCNKGSLKELGEVVAAAHEEAQGCREAVALALCALPYGNHFTALDVSVPRNSGSAPFLALLADTNTCVLEALTFINGRDLEIDVGDWFRRKAEWSLLVHLILHNTKLKSLQLAAGLEKMSEEGGIALADSIRNNRGLEKLDILNTDAFGKEGGGLALAAILRHNSTLRTLDLRDVSLCSRGTEALAKALLHNTTLKSLRLGGKMRGPGEMREEGGIALADSIRNNRGLEELYIERTDAFGKEGGGLALAAMLPHNSTLRILHLSDVRVCSRGTEALAKALVANRGLRELEFSFDGSGPVPFGSAIAGLSDCVLETLALRGLSYCVLETLALCVHPAAADAMIKLLTTSKPSHAAGVSTASSANICYSLRKLTLTLDVHVHHPYQRDTCLEHDGMDAALATDMIRSNQKLVSFTLKRPTYSSLEWADTIIPALESNSTLKELDFYGCKGVDAKLAYNAHQDAVQQHYAPVHQPPGYSLTILGQGRGSGRGAPPKRPVQINSGGLTHDQSQIMPLGTMW